MSPQHELKYRKIIKKYEQLSTAVCDPGADFAGVWVYARSGKSSFIFAGRYGRACSSWRVHATGYGVEAMTSKIIFFDAVGTLFTVKDSVGHIYCQVVADYGVEVDPVILNQSFYQAFSQAPSAAFPEVPLEQVPTLERQWWRQIVFKTFNSLGFGGFPGFEDYFQEVYDLFAQPQAWVLYPETLPVLDYLCSHGIPVGIISNFDTRLLAVLDALHLNPYFSSITSSSSVGYAKPSPAIFCRALEKHGIPAHQALHIGDSYSQDFLGAQRSGLQALWLNREGNMFPRAGEICDLWGIRSVLEQAV